MIVLVTLATTRQRLYLIQPYNFILIQYEYRFHGYLLALLRILLDHLAFFAKYLM